jgi:protein-tyrosine-phosphatase
LPVHQGKTAPAGPGEETTMLGRHRIFRFASLQVWLFALGYFVSYIPYSALAKAMAQGYLTPGQQLISRFDILPPAILGTVITMPLIIAAFGGFHFTATRRILGRNVPFPRIDTLISGLGFAAIIATTTLAYSFSGISIVLALVLMRAGVLTLAPVIDVIVGRSVHRYSWMALALSFAALTVALSQIGSYELTIGAGLNLALYLCGYGARLSMMTRHAKTEDEAVNRRFIAEECIVAMIALAAIAGLFAVVGGCAAMPTPGCAFAAFAANPLFGPGIATGIAYGFLGIFATLIYLNRLENTFAIPVFCCASMLSGLVASQALAWLYGAPPLNGADFISSGLIILAGFVLNARATRGPTCRLAASGVTPAQRLLLFVCSGNTSRSPIAQAICNAEIVRRLARWPDRPGMAGVQVASAGLTATPGAAMSSEAQQALGRLSVPVPQHAARSLTPELIEAATTIICMTKEQCEAVLAISPDARGKVHRLHPFRDLDDPTGQGAKAFLRLSRHIKYLIAQRLSYFMLESGGRA